MFSCTTVVFVQPGLIHFARGINVNYRKGTPGLGVSETATAFNTRPPLFCAPLQIQVLSRPVHLQKILISMKNKFVIVAFKLCRLKV